jgi:hypothetical protein
VKGITGSNVERKGEQIELDLSNPTPRMEISITNNLILTGPVCTLTEKELKHTVSIINRLQFKHPTLITEDDKEHIETLRSCAAILASLAILKEHLKPDSKDTYKLQRFNFIEGTTT